MSRQHRILLSALLAALLIGAVVLIFEPQRRLVDTSNWYSNFYAPVASRSEVYQSSLFGHWAELVKVRLEHTFPLLSHDVELDKVAQAFAFELSTKQQITERDLGQSAAFQRLSAVGPAEGDCWAWYSFSLAETKQILGVNWTTGESDDLWSQYYSEEARLFGVGVFYDPNSPYGVIWTVVLADPGWKPAPEKHVAESSSVSESDLFERIQAWRESNYDAVNPDGQHRVFQSADSLAKAETMYLLINQAREQHDIEPVRRDLQLERLAQAQAIYLATNDDYAHINKEGLNPYDRLLSIEPPLNCYVQENAYVKEDDPARAVDEFMKSNVHRENLLRPQHTMVGIGYYHDPGSRYGHYWVQLFADSALPFDDAPLLPDEDD